jgi:hypothetical protein
VNCRGRCFCFSAKYAGGPSCRRCYSVEHWDFIQITGSMPMLRRSILFRQRHTVWENLQHYPMRRTLACPSVLIAVHRMDWRNAWNHICALCLLRFLDENWQTYAH